MAIYRRLELTIMQEGCKVLSSCDLRLCFPCQIDELESELEVESKGKSDAQRNVKR